MLLGGYRLELVSSHSSSVGLGISRICFMSPIRARIVLEKAGSGEYRLADLRASLKISRA